MKQNYNVFLDGKYSSLERSTENKSKKEKPEEDIHSYYDRALALAAVGGALLGASIWDNVKKITKKVKDNTISKSDIQLVDKIRSIAKRSITDDNERGRILSFLDDLKESMEGLV